MRRQRRGRGKRGALHPQQASYPLQERMLRVGPGKFGILAVDSSKVHFAVMLANFAGVELMVDLAVENTAPALEALVAKVQAACAEHGIVDLVVAIERTGRYHVPIRNVLRKHWDVRMVHPLATKRLREPADPGNKTDLTDLRAIVRAIVAGYGAIEKDLPERWADWREVNRERESLVRKRALFRVQIQERIESLLPGFSALFADLWSSPAAPDLAAHYGSAEAIRQAGETGLLDWLRAAGRRMRRDTLCRILVWAATASAPDHGPELRCRMLANQLALLRATQAQIVAYERDLAGYLAETPFVLLLSCPAVGVVSAAGYGAELGPIEHYAHPANIRGRAGLYPSRYQSDATDLANGPIVRQSNARLRDALIEIAHNLLPHSPYFKAWAQVRKAKGWPSAKLHVAVANKFTRISYAILAGRTLFEHPALGGPDAILRKLYDFARGHGLTAEATAGLLAAATPWMPETAARQEAAALRNDLAPRARHRSAGPDQGSPEHWAKVLGELFERIAAGLPLPDERNRTRPIANVRGRTPD